MFKGVGRGSAGFSFIELLAAIAGLAVVALGVAKISTDLSRIGVRSASLQQKTNLEQSLNSVFENSELCTSILGGTVSAPGTVVSLPVNLLDNDSLKRVQVETVIMKDVIDIDNGNYRTDLLVTGRKKAAVEEKFELYIPVYYKASAAKIIETCYSGRSAYATCKALNGTWNETYCDFCTALGGTRDITGKCSIAAASPPPMPTPTNNRYVLITKASGYNGIQTQSIGTYGHCNLVNYSYDGDGIGECTVTHSGNTWNVTVGDEGTANPQICYMACVPVGTVDTGGTQDGDLCRANGKVGIRIGGCCATGTQFKKLYTIGTGKNAGEYMINGTANDIGCY